MEKQINAHQIEYFKGVEKYLDKALDPFDMKIMMEEVKQKKAQLWEFPDDSFGITRVEKYVEGTKELVLVAAQGRNLLYALEYFKTLAKNHGINKLRLHTKIFGVKKMAEMVGFKEAETVFEMEI